MPLCLSSRFQNEYCKFPSRHDRKCVCTFVGSSVEIHYDPLLNSIPSIFCSLYVYNGTFGKSSNTTGTADHTWQLHYILPTAPETNQHFYIGTLLLPFHFLCVCYFALIFTTYIRLGACNNNVNSLSISNTTVLLLYYFKDL